MPRLTQSLPKYRKHKASGQAVVTLAGRDVYLGPYGTDVSRQEYDRTVAEWLAAGRPAVPRPAVAEISVAEVMVEYLKFVGSRYVKNDSPTSEQHGIRAALRPLCQLYSRQRAVEFGPLALKAVRTKLVELGQARSTVNQNIGRIKRMFKWAASEELIPIETAMALTTVSGFRRGQSTARETSRIKPVADDRVEATIPFLPEVVADMVRVQRLTGMRSGEVVIMRPCDFDRSGEVWFYRPESHKTEHHDRERLIPIGPRAQVILKPYLLRYAEQFCFCPRESSHNATRSASLLKHRVGGHYQVSSYRTAIKRACRRTGVDVWHPNQLRHAAATEIRKRHGLEAAQVALGHASADITQVYAERDVQLARTVALDIG